MADSKRARAGRRRLVLYLGEPDAKRLAERAQLLGESMNAVMRVALRDYWRSSLATFVGVSSAVFGLSASVGLGLLG